MSRSTPGNTAASPAPSSMRAAIATPTLGEKAITSCPTAISTIPIAMTGRDPKRSSSTPTGICMNP